MDGWAAMAGASKSYSMIDGPDHLLIFLGSCKHAVTQRSITFINEKPLE